MNLCRPEPDPTTLRHLLRMEHFRPLLHHRFGARFRTSPRGTPVYYVGHQGTVVSASSALRGRDMKLVVLAHNRHHRTRHHRVQLATTEPRTGARRKAGRLRDPSPKYITLGVHTAVLLAWEGGRHPDEVPWDDACHLDGDVDNNRLSNLCWGDRKTNAAHREAHRWEAIERECRDYADSADCVYEVDPRYGF